MVKQRVSQIVVLLLLAILLFAPIYESFDHWDGFPKSGNDTVESLIAAATFCGLVLVAHRFLVQVFLHKRPLKFERWNPPAILFACVPCKRADESPPGSSSLSLRV
jgi:hypothetical protein